MSRPVIPTPEQLQALAESKHEGAIVMVNLLRYRQRATYEADRAEAKENLSGRAAYLKYGATALTCVLEAGGSIVWGGEQQMVAVGDKSDEWDEVVCVRYPSRAAFLEMIDRPDYRAALYHRDAGLERTSLFVLLGWDGGVGMGRKILFITTDQQRFDSLGCNGNKFCRTPNIDALARSGINYKRAYNQNTVCMPARSTMLTGQYVRTHGVFANGVCLPEDAPSFAQYLKDKAGYKTALIGKAHFEPAFDLKFKYRENARQRDGDYGPWRGFDYAIHAMHTASFRGTPVGHYGRWLWAQNKDVFDAWPALLNASPGGDTGAPETANHAIPRGLYHTDWLADLAVEWLSSLDADEDWMLWLSFPDPHHPWDPPASELSRCDWRDLPLPDGLPKSEDELRKVLAQKPAHWLAYYDGTFANIEGGPMNFMPKMLSHDNIREINAKVHVMNELIDDAVGRVMEKIKARGWDGDTDVLFTTDHGELQGDFGFIYKGPFHVDSLMRLPFIWRPAPNAKVAPATVEQPVEQTDLAPTMCAIAGIEPAPWMQGSALPVADDGTPQRALCEWDSQFPGYGFHFRSIVREGFSLTRYEPSTPGAPNGLEETWPQFAEVTTSIRYDGSEGELYDLKNDPLQWRNLWDDPKYASIKSDLIADLYDNLPEERSPKLKVEAPA